MEKLHPRLMRERVTVEKMVGLFCHEVHGTPEGALCEECASLSRYSNERLRRCPFQENKPTCAKCTVHCYIPAMREKVRVVMRYAGPRMLFHHPVLAVRHMADGLRKAPSIEQVRKKKM
jgi:hypothetical protein